MWKFLCVVTAAILLGMVSPFLAATDDGVILRTWFKWLPIQVNAWSYSLFDATPYTAHVTELKMMSMIPGSPSAGLSAIGCTPTSTGSRRSGGSRNHVHGG